MSRVSSGLWFALWRPRRSAGATKEGDPPFIMVLILASLISNVDRKKSLQTRILSFLHGKKYFLVYVLLDFLSVCVDNLLVLTTRLIRNWLWSLLFAIAQNSELIRLWDSMVIKLLQLRRHLLQSTSRAFLAGATLPLLVMNSLPDSRLNFLRFRSHDEGSAILPLFLFLFNVFSAAINGPVVPSSLDEPYSWIACRALCPPSINMEILLGNQST